MLSRAARRVSATAISTASRQSSLAHGTMISSSFNHLHTHKTNGLSSPASPIISSTSSSVCNFGTIPSCSVSSSSSSSSSSASSFSHASCSSSAATNFNKVRWFSTMNLPTVPLPKLNQSNSTSLLNISSIIPKLTLPQSVTQSIGLITGNMNMVHQDNKIMQRVWEKRTKRLTKATNAILDEFNSCDFTFKTAQIYIRKAGSFDNHQDNAQKEVHIALRGIAHTVVVLQGDNNKTYLLDRVVEGIRLSELTRNEETNCIETCNKFKPDEMVQLTQFNHINISSNQIVNWIYQQRETKYNVVTNNCVQFSLYFYQKFLYGHKFQQALQSVLG